MNKSNLYQEIKSLNREFKEILKSLKMEKKEQLKLQDYDYASQISEQIDMLNYCISRIDNLLKT